MTYEAWMDAEALGDISKPPVQLLYTLTTDVVANPDLWTAQKLFEHLYAAAYVEMSTIPLYLYAAYSIKGQSYSEWSAGRGPVDDFRTIVIEEMLHLCLVRNMIVSIGRGQDVVFYHPDFVPRYPSPMLNRIPRLPLVLEPLSYRLVRDIFMGVEKPQYETHNVPPPNEYFTLGQFYDSVRKGFDIVLSKDPNLFKDNRPDLQYGTAYWNEGGGGGPIVIMKQPWGPTQDQWTLYPLGAVHKALDIIMEQGEGIMRADEGEGDARLCERFVNKAPASPTPGLTEYTHYAKFCRIASGIEPVGIYLDAGGYPKPLELKDAVWPLPANPTIDSTAGSARNLAEFFNAAYCYVLALVDELYKTTSNDVIAGQESKRYGLERTFISSMGGMLFPIADLLVRTPSGKNDGKNAAPPFGYYQYQEGMLKEQLMKLCERSVQEYPSLGGDNSVRWLINLLPDIEYEPPGGTLPAT